MDKKIYKYKLQNFGASETITMPANSKVLYVGHQNDELFLWAEVSDTICDEQYIFYVVATGQDLPSENIVYIGSVQMNYSMGELVWHVYRKL